MPSSPRSWSVCLQPGATLPQAQTQAQALHLFPGLSEGIAGPELDSRAPSPKLLLSVHGASFPPAAQARNRVSSLCFPSLPPPAPPSAEPVGSTLKTHVDEHFSLLSPSPSAWIAALAALWSAWRPLPLTCLLRNHQTHLAKCQSGWSSSPAPPGALPSSPQLSSPRVHSKPQSFCPQPTRLLVLSVRPGQWCGHHCSAVPPATHPGGLQGGGVPVDRTGCRGGGTAMLPIGT